MHFSAVILAAGRSERMGRDKAWLEVDGQPLIRRQIKLVRELDAKEIFISGRADGDYTALQCPVLTDKFPNAGPLAGIERALAETISPLLLVLAVDLPRLTPSVLCELLAHCTAQTGAIPRVNKQIEPLAAFYPRAAQPLAVSLLASGNNAARNFAQNCVAQKLAGFVDLPDEVSIAFTNLNTPNDLVG